jgi:hypothetical protein
VAERSLPAVAGAKCDRQPRAEWQLVCPTKLRLVVEQTVQRVLYLGGQGRRPGNPKGESQEARVPRRDNPAYCRRVEPPCIWALTGYRHCSVTTGCVNLLPEFERTRHTCTRARRGVAAIGFFSKQPTYPSRSARPRHGDSCAVRVVVVGWPTGASNRNEVIVDCQLQRAMCVLGLRTCCRTGQQQQAETLHRALTAPSLHCRSNSPGTRPSMQ